MFYNYAVCKEIEDKLNLDWETVFRFYVKDLITQRGNTFYIPCFLHGENTPSFGVNFDKKVMKCFGCSKGYNNIIMFLMDYLAMPLSAVLEQLNKDGFISNLESLGESFENLVTNNIKKNIYKELEFKPKESHPLMQRVLFDIGGFGKVNQEKIDNIKEKLAKHWNSNKKLKVAENELKGLKMAIEENKETKETYALLSNEYNNILFYSGLPKSKTQTQYLVEFNAEFAYVEHEFNFIQNLKKDIALFQSLARQSRGYEAIEIQNDEKKKRFFGGKGYKDFLKKQIKIDPEDYIENLLKIFFYQTNKVNYFFGEGFFDVYSLGMIGLPYFLNGSSYGANKIYSDLKYFNKSAYHGGYDAVMNLCFDNDKAGMLLTTRFVNQYLKLKQQRIIFDTKIALKIFNFKSFEIKINRLISILVYLSKEGKSSLGELFKEIASETIDFSTRDTNLFENYFFSKFENVNYQDSHIESIRKKFQFNYQEPKNKEEVHKKALVKDMGDLPIIIFGIQSFLESFSKINLKGVPEEEQILLKQAFKDLICYSVNSIFFNSFMSVDDFREFLNKRIDMDDVPRGSIEHELEQAGDYIYGKPKLNRHNNKNYEECFNKAFSSLIKKVDIEFEALLKLNFLCYDKELSSCYLVNSDEREEAKKYIKSQFLKGFPNILSKKIDELNEYNKKIDDVYQILSERERDSNSEELFEQLQNNKNNLMKKMLLYFNLWKKLCNTSIKELGRIYFSEKKYSESEIEQIVSRKKEYIVTQEAKSFNEMHESYLLYKQFIEDKILMDIQNNSLENNMFNLIYFKKAMYKLYSLNS